MDSDRSTGHQINGKAQEKNGKTHRTGDKHLFKVKYSTLENEWARSMPSIGISIWSRYRGIRLIR